MIMHGSVALDTGPEAPATVAEDESTPLAAAHRSAVQVGAAVAELTFELAKQVQACTESCAGLMTATRMLDVAVEEVTAEMIFASAATAVEVAAEAAANEVSEQGSAGWREWHDDAKEGYCEWEPSSWLDGGWSAPQGMDWCSVRQH